MKRQDFYEGEAGICGLHSFPDGGFENSWERGWGAGHASQRHPRPGLDPSQPLASRQPDLSASSGTHRVNSMVRGVLPATFWSSVSVQKWG